MICPLDLNFECPNDELLDNHDMTCEECHVMHPEPLKTMVVYLNEQNSKRLWVFFPQEKIEMLVNDIVDNAILDFMVFLENIDNEKFQKFYEEMTSDEELPVV